MIKACAFPQSKIIVYTLLLGTIAALCHFAYDFSGGNAIVGLFCPVNESIWEHLKLMFFPFLLWWIVLYQIKIKTCNATLNTWIVAACVSLVVAPLMVVFLYYSYTGAFGIESVSVDILLTYICYFIALEVASHLLEYLEPNNRVTLIWVIVVVVIFMMFIVFTSNPPELPLFFDNSAT